jgi:hypothetical protein
LAGTPPRTQRNLSIGRKNKLTNGKTQKSHASRPGCAFSSAARVRTSCVPFSDEPKSVLEPRIERHSEPAQVPQTYVSTYGTPPARPSRAPPAVPDRDRAALRRSRGAADARSRRADTHRSNVGRSRLDPIATSARRGRTRRGGGANAPLSPAVFVTVPSTLLLRILTFALPSAPPPRSFSHHVRCLLCWRPDG